MTIEIFIVLFILVTAALMFATNLIRSDLVAMLALLALLLSGTLSVEEAFAGFSSSTVLIVAAMFIVGEAIVFTGIASWLGGAILRYGGTSELRILVLIMVVSGLAGSFMSSTATAAIFIPITLFVAEKANLNHRRLLMPLSIAALISGMMTLIATTPNLIVNDALAQQGLDQFHFFSFTPFGIFILIVAVLFMVFIGRHVLSRSRTAEQTQKNPSIRQMMTSYGLAGKFHRVRIDSGSSLIDRAVIRFKLRENYNLLLIVVERRVDGKLTIVKPSPGTVLKEGDILYVLGSEDMCFAFSQNHNLRQLSIQIDNKTLKLIYQAIGAAEVMLTPDSTFIGKTLKTSQFQQRFNGLVIGVRRQGEAITENLTSLSLTFGDVLLISSDWEGIGRLKGYRDDFLVLTLPEEFREVIPGQKRMPLVVGILSAMVLAILTGALPTVTATVSAAVLLILTRCLRLETIYRVISWQTVILIAAILPLATALNKSGASDLLADRMTTSMGSLAPILMLAFIFMATALVGLFISNTATAVLIAPIAIDVALNLGVSPHAFAMTVAIACSSAFVTPVSTPVNLLVQEPGRYAFIDYVKVGLPMQLVTLICTVTIAWFLYLK